VAALVAHPKIDLKHHMINTHSLCLAIQQGHHEVIRLFLSHTDIDVNAPFPLEKHRYTSPCVACLKGHVEVVHVLNSAPGIDVNKMDAMLKNRLLILQSSMDLRGRSKTIKTTQDDSKNFLTVLILDPKMKQWTKNQSQRHTASHTHRELSTKTTRTPSAAARSMTPSV